MKVKNYILIGILLITLTSFSYIFNSNPDPILTRHDKDEAEFLKLAERFEKYMCHLNLPDCEGTIIADQWVISAAHCAEAIMVKFKNGRRHFVVINDVEIEVDKVIMYKEWDDEQLESTLSNIASSNDIALLHLKTKPTNAKQAKLYVDEDEVDKLIYMVGKGDKGDGLVGVNGNDGKQRGITNRIETAIGNWLTWTFDHPDTQTKYLTEYEGISGPGDSGGPAFILKNDTVYLAGISSWQDRKGGDEGLYEVVENYTRVSQYIQWINDEMTGNNTDSEAILRVEPAPDAIDTRPKAIDVGASTLKQYVGEYDYEAEGLIIKIYTKEKENYTKLYFYLLGEGEIELIPAGKHKFSFQTEEEIKVEFKNLENGVFNELIVIQSDETFKAVRLEIDDLTTIDKKLIQRDFSGVILIAQNDSILFNKAYGRKNSQEKGLNDLNTVFDICSITKQFTAAGILKLSMQNKLSISDKLSKYFPTVPDDKKNITIHQLLTHSSGLTAGIGGDYDTITEETFLSNVFSSKLISPVGKEFNYSNMGYSLLALIIEKVSGRDYETFLNVSIFKPSKMNHTGYVIPDWKNNEVANGFLNGTEAKKPNEENWSEQGPYLNLKGNGGILTRASDLLLWSQAIRNNTVLDKATTSNYLYPHFEYNSGNSYYGYGWGIANNGLEDKLVRHAGGSDLFTSDLWMYPEKGITIIVLSNTLDLFVLSIAKRISNFLLSK